MIAPTAVRLTPAEVAFASTLAAQRLATKAGPVGFQAAKVSPYGMHLAGVLSELAAARVYGARVDQTVRPQGDGHAADLTARDGRQLEVKATTYTGADPMLKLNAEHLRPGVHYVLVQIAWPDVCTVYPPISSERVCEIGEQRDFGYGARWVVSAGKILARANKEVA